MGRVLDSELWLLSMGFRGIRGALRVMQLTTAFADGFALGILSEEARTQLTALLYERAGPSQRADLYDWERTWFEEDLPGVPANVLVGGAGAGRELRWLEARGYTALGFDPVAADSGSDTDIIRASYEDLIAASSPAAARIQRGGRYDAVLLGWGSYTHVSRARDRSALLVRLRELCDGPVLLSFWAASGISGRAKRAGFRVGTVLGKGAEVELVADSVHSHCGYGHGFTREELIALARGAGYRIQFRDHGTYPHATLVPEVAVD